jgi:DNA-binding NtrC family response regulator
MVKEGKFRDDLYYRISVFPIMLPALRERSGDIIPLSKHFVNHFSAKMGKTPIVLSSEVEKILIKHKWEGNIRELQNIIERAVILCKNGVIRTEHLPTSIVHGYTPPELNENISQNNSVNFDIPPNGLSLDDLEKQLVAKALERSKNNITKAAKLLGLTRGTFRYRLQKYGISN